MSYPVPKDTVRYETVIRKSRFIAITGPACDAATVRRFIDNVSAEFNDARHICYAYITGSPDAGTRACGDDGEPQGTAGKPMLNVLQHSGVGDIVAVVVRYFGGIKLGAGGLARAYGGSVAQTIKLLPTAIPVATSEILILAPFALENNIRHLLNQHRAEKLEVNYGSDLEITANIPVDELASLRPALAALGRGQIEMSLVDQTSRGNHQN